MENKKLKILMIKNDLKNKDMVELLNISESSFLNKKKGRKNFTQAEIEKLLKIFNVDYNELF